MEKISLRRQLLNILGTITLFFGGVLSGCQAERPEQQEPSTLFFEELSSEKQVYLQRGLIELIPDDLTAPVLPEEPVQADLGEEPYYQICMACHGNWGQGLTDEWRETGFGEDMNCWQSKCHATNHPPQGFEFPREVPPLLGKGAMSGIADAQQLYQVIYETMPWWDPGQLSVEQSLNLTAYIMRAREELPEGVVLTEANLAAFPLHVAAPEIVDEKPGGIILVIGLTVAMLAYLWTKRLPEDIE